MSACVHTNAACRTTNKTHTGTQAHTNTRTQTDTDTDTQISWMWTSTKAVSTHLGQLLVRFNGLLVEVILMFARFHLPHTTGQVTDGRVVA